MILLSDNNLDKVARKDLEGIRKSSKGVVWIFL